MKFFQSLKQSLKNDLLKNEYKKIIENIPFHQEENNGYIVYLNVQDLSLRQLNFLLDILIQKNLIIKVEKRVAKEIEYLI